MTRVKAIATCVPYRVNAQFLAACFLVLAVVPVAGQTIQAVRLNDHLRLDGVLDEGLYAVPPITGFLQTEPDEGALATERTEVWVAFDHEHVYVSFRCFETDISRMIVNEMRRDSGNIWQGNDLVGHSSPELRQLGETLLEIALHGR